jgi:hypothetical protein
MSVTIETDSVKSESTGPVKELGHIRPDARPPNVPKPEGRTGHYVEISKKYNSKNRSGLTATLTAGNNSKNFDLVD